MARQRVQPQAAAELATWSWFSRKVTKAVGGSDEARRAARRVLPVVPLPLKQIAVSRRRDELLRRAPVVVVVGFSAAGQGDVRRMMEVIVPERVEAVAALRRSAGQARLLRLVLGDEEDLPSSGGGLRTPAAMSASCLASW